MATFHQLFGDKPRIRLLEALLRLSGLTFTRAEWAAEAGLQKSSTNRIAMQLEKEGLVRRIGGAAHAQYEVVLDNPYIRIMDTLEAALELVEYAGEQSTSGGVVDSFRVRQCAW